MSIQHKSLSFYLNSDLLNLNFFFVFYIVRIIFSTFIYIDNCVENKYNLIVDKWNFFFLFHRFGFLLYLIQMMVLYIYIYVCFLLEKWLTNHQHVGRPLLSIKKFFLNLRKSTNLQPWSWYYCHTCHHPFHELRLLEATNKSINFLQGIYHWCIWFIILSENQFNENPIFCNI